MKALVSSVLNLCLIAGVSDRANAVMVAETADPLHNTTTPGDNSGWQYEGKFTFSLGVPIAPYFFITATHVGGTVGVTTFDFHGDLYTTIGKSDSPDTDLTIWEVDHSKPFPTYAPLSSGAVDVGATAAVFGRGTERQALPWIVGGDSKGWKWGSPTDVKRWGRNVVTGSFDNGPGWGHLLYCDFNNPGIANECHLSIGDSGGGLFVLENGLWRLAGINLAVDGPFRTPAAGPVPAGPVTGACLYDMGGLEYENPPGTWNLIPNTPTDNPSSFYCARISASLPWITGIAPAVTSLAAENYTAWQKLYFTPSQIAVSATTGPLADFDADGIANLLEFALNLEPGFNAQTIMTPVTGLSGLPVVRLENISGANHVTIEFVRRTAGSGAGLTYTPQFSSDLDDWQTIGSETVVSINPRWDRVKVVDPETTTSEVKRFARLKVAQ
ncbi:MAG: hypothetical protein V4689_08625 [Verrucomicrobiota bacterium]